MPPFLEMVGLRDTLPQAGADHVTPLDRAATSRLFGDVVVVNLGKNPTSKNRQIERLRL